MSIFSPPPATGPNPLTGAPCLVCSRPIVFPAKVERRDDPAPLCGRCNHRIRKTWGRQDPSQLFEPMIYMEQARWRAAKAEQQARRDRRRWALAEEKARKTEHWLEELRLARARNPDRVWP